ncbi:MAG: FAD/NAD(P)-binding protein [Fimbriimonas sp.]
MRGASRRRPPRGSVRLKRVAIVGAGFSGTALASTLLERSLDPIQVMLFERSGEFGAGLAFSTDDPHHLLNVPAAKMSAFADRPTDFADWLAESGADLGDGFVPRRLYRRYLQDRLDRPPFHPGSSQLLISREVVAIDGGFRLRTREGDVFDADYVVLATGYAPRSTRGFHAYEPQHWPSQDIRKVAIFGAGLTALDVAVSIFERHPDVLVEMFSRHGVLPEPFGIGIRPATLHAEPPLGDLRQMLHWLRAEIARAGWEPVFEAMRYRWNSLWQNLSDSDRRRFVRHLSSRFSRFRHRVPPALWHQIARHRESGRLVIRSGNVCEVGPHRLRLSDGPELRFDLVIDASGVSYAHPCDGDGLIPQLLEAQRIEHGRIGLGIRIPSTESRFFVLGPPLRGDHWESTAVPDIREQIAEVSREILSDESCSG